MGRGLNPRPPAYKAAALTTELPIVVTNAHDSQRVKVLNIVSPVPRCRAWFVVSSQAYCPRLPRDNLALFAQRGQRGLHGAWCRGCLEELDKLRRR